MDVQVKDCLAAVGIGIDDHAIAVFGKAAASRDVRSRNKQVSKHGGILRGGLVQRIDVNPRNDQYMNRSLRGDVIERDAYLVLVHQCRRYFGCCYLAEYTIIHRSHSRAGLVGGFCQASRYALDIGPQRTELAYDPFVPAVDVVNAVDERLSFSTKGRQH